MYCAHTLMCLTGNIIFSNTLQYYAVYMCAMDGKLRALLLLSVARYTLEIICWSTLYFKVGVCLLIGFRNLDPTLVYLQQLQHHWLCRGPISQDLQPYLFIEVFSTTLHFYFHLWIACSLSLHHCPFTCCISIFELLSYCETCKDPHDWLSLPPQSAKLAWEHNDKNNPCNMKHDWKKKQWLVWVIVMHRYRYQYQYQPKYSSICEYWYCFLVSQILMTSCSQLFNCLHVANCWQVANCLHKLS